MTLENAKAIILITVGCLLLISPTTCIGAAPTLSDVSFSPSEVAAGISTDIGGSFTFNDPDGDLGGGSFNYTYESVAFSFELPSSINGVTSGTVGFSLEVVLSQTVGTIIIPCWLEDRNGNPSNMFEVSVRQLWTRQFGTVGEDIGEALTIGGSKSIYVTGKTFGDLDGEMNAGGIDVFLTKFNPSSAKEWTKLLGSTSADFATGVAVDSGNICDITGDGKVDLQDSIVAFQILIGMPSLTALELGRDVNDDDRIGIEEALCAMGVTAGDHIDYSNVYVTGYTFGDNFDGHLSAGTYDIFLAKYDASGKKLWTKLLGSADWDKAFGIAVDSKDNIYITGQTSGDLDGNDNAGGQDAFIARYDSSGTKMWTKLFGGFFDERGNAIAVGGGDSIYITGGADGGLGGVLNSDIFLAKFDTSGNEQWLSKIATHCYESGTGVAVDSSGNVYVTGIVLTCSLDDEVALGKRDVFLSKFDSSGNKLWVRQFGTEETDKGFSVAVDGADNVYVVGYWDSTYFTGDNEGGDVFLAKYSPSGDRLWIEERVGSEVAQGKGVAIDADNYIFMTGTTEGSYDGHQNASQNEDDVFVLKYDVNGMKQ
jgi:hypothetical protein